MAVIKGTKAANKIAGYTSNDTIFGYDGSDIVSGGDGLDVLYGGSGTDRLSGNNGNDTIIGGDGNDWVYGDPGNDRLFGGLGDDEVFGGTGDDFLFGSAGNDILTGGSGNDNLQGGDANDQLIGNAGNDFLMGGLGADVFVLGDGYDTINDWNASQGDVIDITAALIRYNANTDMISDFVRVVRNDGTSTSTISIDANGMSDGIVNFTPIGLVKNSIYGSARSMIADRVLIAPRSTSDEPVYEEPTGRASDLIEFLGVNVKIEPTDANSVAGTIASKMNYLGIKNIRVQPEAPIDSSDTAPTYDALADAGFDFNFLMRRDHDVGGKALLKDYVAHFNAFLKAHPGSIKSVEGINEIGNPVFSFDYEGLTGKKAVSQYQKDLYTAINSSAALKDIPVYNFTVFYGKLTENYVGFDDLSDYSDAATAHVYITTDYAPYDEMTNRLNTVKIIDGNSPNVITEMGYPSNPMKNNSIAVPETVQAKLILNMIANAYDHGVEAAYLYELFDGGTDKTNNKDNFGLFRINGTAKTSATALHNFTTILNQDTGSGAVNSVGYELGNADGRTHSFSLAKSGGATEIVIWREEQIWDYKNLIDISVAPRTINVSLDETARSVDVYDPILGTSSTAHMSNIDEFDVQVTDHPIVLLIDL